MSKAREIADERFARGEIDESTYLEIIGRLSSGSKFADTDHPETVVAPVSTAYNGSWKNLTFSSKVLKYCLYGYCLVAFLIYRVLSKNEDNLAVYNDVLQVMSGEALGTTANAVLSLMMFTPDLIAAVFGLMWIYRACSNLSALRVPELEISPGWSVGWFFVPVAFFWMPIKALQQIYAGSHFREHWKSQPLAIGVVSWWLLFWASELFAIAFIPTEIQGVAQAQKMTYIIVAYNVLAAASLSVFVAIVEECTGAQIALKESQAQ